MGRDIVGVDSDERSIQFGRELLVKHGLDPSRLQVADLQGDAIHPNVIIAAEVFEHIPTSSLHDVLDRLHELLPPNGRLLVTVPNGYGWFELESFLWFKAGVGFVLERTKVVRAIQKVKAAIGREGVDYPLSTLADSPHVQRFTLASVTRLLRQHGFAIRSSTGSVLFAGPFSNLLLSGFARACALNNRLGSAFPHLAAGYFMVCQKSPA